MMPKQIFDLLDDYRLLPKYQLERRADIFFALFLPAIIESKLGHHVTAIIPEFPLMRGLYKADDIKNQHLSSNVDYLVVCEQSSKVYFIELKTDMRSKDNEQLERMNKCSKLPVRSLLNGVIAISGKSDSKRKYVHLLQKLVSINWLTKNMDGYSVVCKDYQVEVIYIQPKRSQNADHQMIGFDEIAQVLEQHPDALAKRFAESLYKWSESPN